MTDLGESSSLVGPASKDRPAGARASRPVGHEAPSAAAGTLDEATRRAARAFLHRIGGKYPAVAMLIFGSRARGTHDPDSDVDLAVILAGPRGDRYAVAGTMAEAAFDVMLETGVLVDPLPLWEIELERPEQSGNPTLIASIKRDGRRLG